MCCLAYRRQLESEVVRGAEGVGVIGAEDVVSSPSMTVNGNAVNIAATGDAAPARLLFYWAINGTSTWHAEAIASTDNLSAPSMTANNGSVNIAIQGPGTSLRFYWAVNGTATWHPETVAGPGSVA
jgi:hypothetical protein